MSKENLDTKMQKLGELVSDVELEISQFFIKMLGGHDINSPELYNVALNILDKANKVVRYFEDNDENLNIETSKLGESVDKLFKDDPVTEYVTARVNHIKDDNAENFLALLKAISKVQAAQDQKEEQDMAALAERIEKVEDAYYTEMKDIMNEIEDKYAHQSTFTPEDVEILRVYLRNLPYNSGADIDALSDRAVVLGFKKHMYAKGK